MTRWILPLCLVVGVWSCAVDDRQLIVQSGDGDGDGDGDGPANGGSLGDGDGDGDGSGGSLSGGSGGTGPDSGGDTGAGGFFDGSGGAVPDWCTLNPLLIHNMETDSTCFGGGLITVRGETEVGDIWPDTVTEGVFTYTELAEGDPYWPGRAARMIGTGPFSDYAPNLTLIFKWDEFVNLLGYSGIRMRVRSDVCDGCQLRVAVQTSSVRSNSTSPPLGTCDETIEACFDSFGTDVTIPTAGDWHDVEVWFETMTQAGWGEPKPFNLEESHSVLIYYTLPEYFEMGDLDLWVDEVELFY